MRHIATLTVLALALSTSCHASPADCDAIQNEKARIFCRAIAGHNRSLCGYPSFSSQEFHECEAAVTGNAGDCEAISNATDRNFCRATAR